MSEPDVGSFCLLATYDICGLCLAVCGTASSAIGSSSKTITFGLALNLDELLRFFAVCSSIYYIPTEILL